MNKPTLAELKTAWLAAKTAERNANEERLAVEQAILALMPQKSEGAVTDAETGVSVTFKVTRTVDTEAVQRDWTALPPSVQDAFKWKADLDTKKFKALQELVPTDFTVLARYVTSKASKPSITCKEST
jgi:hypothetical protein